MKTLKNANVFLFFLLSLISMNCLAQQIPDYFEQSASAAIGFVRNKGQVINTDNDSVPSILYHSVHSSPKSYFFDDKISFVLSNIDTVSSDSDELSRIDLLWVGENALHSVPDTLERKDQIINYYLSHCPSGCDSLSVYSRLIYEDIYPNIDFHIYSNNEAIKFYFVINPGGDPHNIRLEFQGQENMEVNPYLLELRFTIHGQEFVIPNGVVYQVDGANHISNLAWANSFSSNYSNTVEFNVGSYDDTKTLVYEFASMGKTQAGAWKNLDYSELWGEGLNNWNTKFWDIKTTYTGESYVVGSTDNPNFPVTAGAYQGTNAGFIDALILKFLNVAHFNYNIWCTYYGGGGSDGVAKFGVTEFSNYPITMFSSEYRAAKPIPLKNFGQYNHTTHPDERAFDYVLAMFNYESGTLMWSSYLDGGNAGFDISDVTCDSYGNLFVVGGQDHIPYHDAIGSDDHFDNTNANGWFVAKFGDFPNFPIEWCTSIGAGSCHLRSVEIDNENRILVAGEAYANTQTPIHPNISYEGIFGGGNTDAFIARFGTNLHLDWFAYLGGNNIDRFNRLCVRENGDIIAIGETKSNNLLVTENAIQDGYQGQGGTMIFGDGDGFVEIFNSDLENIYNTYLGGTNYEALYAVSALAGNVLIGGATSSSASTFPFLSSNIQSPSLFYDNIIDGNFDGIIVGLDGNYDLKWTTYVGGEGYDPGDGYPWSGAAGEDMIWSSTCWKDPSNVDNHIYYYVVGEGSYGLFPLVNDYKYGQAGKDFLQFPGSQALFQRYEFSSQNLGIAQTNHFENKMKVFPNPASDELNLKMNEMDKKQLNRVEVFDIYGKKMIEFSDIKKDKGLVAIPIFNLSQGVYIVYGSFVDGSSISKKFTKF